MGNLKSHQKMSKRNAAKIAACRIRDLSEKHRNKRQRKIIFSPIGEFDSKSPHLSGISCEYVIPEGELQNDTLVNKEDIIDYINSDCWMVIENGTPIYDIYKLVHDHKDVESVFRSEHYDKEVGINRTAFEEHVKSGVSMGTTIDLYMFGQYVWLTRYVCINSDLFYRMVRVSKIYIDKFH